MQVNEMRTMIIDNPVDGDELEHNNLPKRSSPQKDVRSARTEEEIHEHTRMLDQEADEMN